MIIVRLHLWIGSFEISRTHVILTRYTHGIHITWYSRVILMDSISRDIHALYSWHPYHVILTHYSHGIHITWYSRVVLMVSMSRDTHALYSWHPYQWYGCHQWYGCKSVSSIGGMISIFWWLVWYWGGMILRFLVWESFCAISAKEIFVFWILVCPKTRVFLLFCSPGFFCPFLVKIP